MYLYGPVGILILCNVVFFLLTATHLCQSRKESALVSRNSRVLDRNHHAPPSATKQRLVTCVKAIIFTLVLVVQVMQYKCSFCDSTGYGSSLVYPFWWASSGRWSCFRSPSTTRTPSGTSSTRLTYWLASLSFSSLSVSPKCGICWRNDSDARKSSRTIVQRHLGHHRRTSHEFGGWRCHQTVRNSSNK